MSTPGSGTSASIDLNADVGESWHDRLVGDDAALVPLLSSANVACGGHGGDRETMRRTLDLAVDHGVVVGAHVSYADIEGFGRVDHDVPPADLAELVVEQTLALTEAARAAGTRVRYVKPHGALYHRLNRDAERASVVVAALGQIGTGLGLLTLPGSQLALAARAAGLPVFGEAFADRGYTADGGLVPRGQPGDVITDPEAVAARVVGLARDGVVHDADGTPVPVRSDSVCVHGDTPGAVALARRVREGLDSAGIRVQSFISGEG